MDRTRQQQLADAVITGRMWGRQIPGLQEGSPQAERFWGAYDFGQILLRRMGLADGAEAFREAFEEGMAQRAQELGVPA